MSAIRIPQRPLFVNPLSRKIGGCGSVFTYALFIKKGNRPPPSLLCKCGASPLGLAVEHQPEIAKYLPGVLVRVNGGVVVEVLRVVRALPRQMLLYHTERIEVARMQIAGRTVRLAEYAGQKEHLDIRGVMSVLPVGAPEELYERVRTLYERLQAQCPGADTLSMGMSGDYETAVKHGANLIRIGTALFGKRTYEVENNV